MFTSGPFPRLRAWKGLRCFLFLALVGCQTAPSSSPAPKTSEGVALSAGAAGMVFAPLDATTADDVVLAEGFTYQTLSRFGDVLNDRSETVGKGALGVAAVPVRSSGDDELIVWVAHGSNDTPHGLPKRTREQAEAEMLESGGSLIHFRLEQGRWKVVKDSSYNRRLTGQTPIMIASDEPVSGGRIAMGALGGGDAAVTPWKTILAGEDRYDEYFGDVRFQGKKRMLAPDHSGYRWDAFFPRPPEHYGWVLEIDPKTARSQKLTALGRFHHGAIAVAADTRGTGIRAIYMTDSKLGLLFKFIPAKPDSLAHGKLYAANFRKSAWIELDQENLLRASSAAEAVGAGTLGRVGDLAVNAATTELLIAVNKSKDHAKGAIFKLNDKDDAHFEMMKSDIEVEYPFGMAATADGRLWITTDGPDTAKANNSLFWVSPDGKSVRAASAPKQSRFASPWVASNGLLLLSVENRAPEKSTLIAIQSRLSNH